MAGLKTQTIRAYRSNPRKKRPGVISKKRTSRNKASKFYKKAYRGQGR